MTIQNIADLTGAPEIGKYYLVPTVRAEWFGRVRDWPVIGPKHNDAHCLKFDYEHYHFDERFMPGDDEDYEFWCLVAGTPLIWSNRINPEGLPPPVLRRRKCRRLANPFRASLDREIAGFVARDGRWACHFHEWAGRQARHDGRSWVCPHRKVPLAGQPIVDGVITCPLHHLRIDAETGVVLPPAVAP